MSRSLAKDPEIDLVQSEVVTYLTRKARKTPLKIVDREGNVVGEVDPVAHSVEILQKAGFIFEHEAGRKQSVCAGSHQGRCPTRVAPPKHALYACFVRLRKGRPWRCRECSNHEFGEVRAEAIRKRIAGLSAKQMAEFKEACRLHGASRPKVTQCPKGHPYDDTNTVIGGSGARICRKCQRQHRKKLVAKRVALGLCAACGLRPRLTRGGRCLECKMARRKTQRRTMTPEALSEARRKAWATRRANAAQKGTPP